jgi:hypothetical protein
MKIRILTATTETASNGLHFTKEALQQLADTEGTIPVTWGFNNRNILGKVLEKEVTDSGLVTTIEVDEERVLNLMLDNKTYIVPAFKYPEMHLVEAAFTLNPVDLTLPHIETHHIVD